MTSRISAEEDAPILSEKQRGDILRDVADGTDDQESAQSMDSDVMEEEGSSATTATAMITNPHVCEATRSRLLHRKRPCVSSSSIEDGGMTAITEKATVVTLESVAAASSSAATTRFETSSASSSDLEGSTTTSRPMMTAAKSTVTVPQTEEEERLDKMMEACRTILVCMGEDPGRDGLMKTPERWAKALLFMTSGYATTPQEVTNGAIFEENHDEMVVVRNMNIHSLCEHHMLPFTGVVHVGYIPNGKIVGLSKLARIAELYARRLQVQERLTRQIADAVVEMVEPLGVAVVVECTHFCMVMRGVQQVSAVTTTSSVRGCFESNPKTRAEFFSILHNGRIKMC